MIRPIIGELGANSERKNSCASFATWPISFATTNVSSVSGSTITAITITVESNALKAGRFVSATRR
jgi:hypothetical protein